MAKIDGFRIQNFKALKDIALGQTSKSRKEKPLTSLTVVIGKNGAGKSSLFDAFGFLADCLKFGVDEACYMKERGGYNKIKSKGQEGPIEFELYFRENAQSQAITYELSIDLDEYQKPFVLKERLRQRRKGEKDKGQPFSFLILNKGKGYVWKGDSLSDLNSDNEKKIKTLFNKLEKSENEKESKETEKIELEDNRKLGISTLGSLKQHPRISFFRKFAESWYLSYFSPKSARSLPLAGPQKQLNETGDNLGNVVQYMEREHKEKFKKILNEIAEKIPGIEKIDTEESSDGRLLLRFNNQGFKELYKTYKNL